MIHGLSMLAGPAIAVLAIPMRAQAGVDQPAGSSIVLRPAAAPVPALKYRLLPERNTLVPGNAAVFYHRAIEMVLQSRYRAQRPKEPKPAAPTDETIVAAWLDGPLSSIPRDRARRWLDQNHNALHEIELGARRQDCNWELDLREREEGIYILIEEIQEMRSLARRVALQVRVAVMDGRKDDAIYWLQTGHAMARHVSQGPLLIQALVATGLAHVMTKPLEDLIQALGMPSLYWALADRVHPLIDMSWAVDSERFQMEREIPQLRELDTAPWSVENARAFSEDMRDKFFKIAGLRAPASSHSAASGLEHWSYRLGLAALVAQAYPEAKHALLAQGRAPAQVEAMPAVQVAALHTFQKYQQIRDDVFKWSSLPYYQAYQGMDKAFLGDHARAQDSVLLKLFTLLIPGMKASLLATTMVERRLDAIQCIEAIRLHAAAHGQLPGRLEEISEAPAPLDVATGKAFDYRVDGDHATLSALAPPGAPAVEGYMIRYELNLTR